MEPTQSPSEPEVHSVEDIVHIEDSRPTGDMSLSDSIVNVEKEDLLDDAIEQEEYKDSGSVVSGGDAAFGNGDGADYGESSSQTTKAELPEELAKKVVILTCESTGISGSCDVYLIGTNHVSMESCREVKAIISILKPEAVFLELCLSRLSVLKPQTLKIPTISDMIESWKQKQNTFGILYCWLLAKISSLRECPGNEFSVAYEEALKYGGKVILGDRPIQITLKRSWDKRPLRHKVKLMFYFLFQVVFLPIADILDRMLKEMNNEDRTTLANQALKKEFPSVMDTLVHERDQYMASSLLRVASEHNSVVAVIGRRHVNGIKKNWKQPITMIDLMEIPRDESTVKRIISLVAIAIAGIAIVSGILLLSRM